MKRQIVILIITAMLTVVMDSQVAANYVDMVKSHDPVGYWRLDETSGNIASDDMTTQDGQYNGGVLLGQEGALSLDCDENLAAKFNGCDSYVAIEHHQAFNLGEGTVQLWFKDTGTIRDVGLLSKDSRDFDDGGHLTIYLDDSKVNVRLQSTDSSYYVLNGSAIELDNWYMVSFTFGPAGMKLYINDQQVDDEVYIGGLGGNLEPIVLGANSWGSDNQSVTPLSGFYSGLIDEVVLYDKVLSQQEIKGLYDFATTCIPEPATMILLGIGGTFLLRRRRK